MTALAHNVKGGAVLVGLIVYVVDLIDFINIATLYIFLNFPLPGNLESALQGFLNSMRISPSPMFNITAFTAYENVFARPTIFRQNRLSFNFFSHFVNFASQLVIFLAVFSALNIISRKIGNNKVGEVLRRRFEKTEYSNGIECYLSSFMNFGFCASASLLDFRVTCFYKCLCNAFAILTIFATGLVAIVHPVVLRQTKKDKSVETEVSYLQTLRPNKTSELYVHSKVLLGSVIAISVPLTPPLAALVLINLATVLKLIAATKAQFAARWIKSAKVTYIVLHMLFNLALLAIYVSNLHRAAISTASYIMLGWVATVFLIACVAIDVFILIGIVIYELSLKISKCLKSSSENVKMNIEKIVPT